MTSIQESKTIAVLDGDAASRRSFARVFESKGHRVVELTKSTDLAGRLASLDALVLDIAPSPLATPQANGGAAGNNGVSAHAHTSHATPHATNGATHGHGHLPDYASGLDLVMRLRKERPDLAMVIVSVDTNVESVVKAMRLGATDYVAKPATEKRVLEAVDRLLDATSLQGMSLGLPRLPTLDEIEKRAIDCALTITKGQVSQAARMLGIGRATLYRKLAEMGREPASSRPRLP